MSVGDDYANAQFLGMKLGVVFLLVILIAHACGVDFRTDAQKACEAKHGIWLARESKCIPGFPVQPESGEDNR